MGLENFMSQQRIEVTRIAIGVGVDQNGQVVNAMFVASETTKLFVSPGKFCAVEITRNGKKTVRETPLGVYGWEYDVA